MGLWVRGCVGALVRGSVGAWVCGSVGAWVRVSLGAWVRDDRELSSLNPFQLLVEKNPRFKETSPFSEPLFPSLHCPPFPLPLLRFLFALPFFSTSFFKRNSIKNFSKRLFFCCRDSFLRFILLIVIDIKIDFFIIFSVYWTKS